MRLKDSEKCNSLVILDAGVDDGNPEVGDDAQVEEAQTNHDVRAATEFPIAEKLQDSDEMVLQNVGPFPETSSVLSASHQNAQRLQERWSTTVMGSLFLQITMEDLGSYILHENCTEWAPNIYFVDGKAIDLEAEVLRSRRIKCCCCGIKGAALGCYEKSCHKSFHLTCAMKIPQCRWDTITY